MNDAPLLEIDDASFDYRSRVGRSKVRALDHVSLDVRAGEVVGLVGESGSGKSTLGRAVLGMIDIDDGDIRWEGASIARLDHRRRRPLRRQVQVVFQDPYSSLNPSQLIGDCIAELIRFHFGATRSVAWSQATELLERVGLSAREASSYPFQLSGGQRQRVAIARALAVRPRLIVCDEPVSSLDVSTQAQIINLFKDLQRDDGLAYLFIAHDLAVVRQMSDRMAVMHRGRIVEAGFADEICTAPAHPYTRALIDSVPEPDPRTRARFLAPHEREERAVRRDATDPGCLYLSRCPEAMPVCATDRPWPALQPTGTRVACHLYRQPDVNVDALVVPEIVQSQTKEVGR